MTSGEVTLTREHLYQFVWSEPIRTVAAQYGLSDRGLAKICLRLNVPVSGHGHWQMKAAGKALSRPRLRPLSPSAPPQERQITLGRSSSHMILPAPNSAAGRQAILERAPDRLIAVSSDLVDPHSLVSRTAKALRRAKADNRRILVADTKVGLDVRVTRKSLDRALRILDALLKALEVRGVEVKCAEGDQQRTSVRILDEDIGFYLEEGIREEKRIVKRRPSHELVSYFPNPPTVVEHVVHDHIPTGELALRIIDGDYLGVRRTWRDGRRQRLERILNRFIVSLVAVAEAEKAERQRREDRQKQWEEQRRLEAERARIRQEDERRIRLLKEDLAAWRTSREIRQYVAAVRTEVGARCTSDEQGHDLHQWLTWVEAYANRLDPMVRATPPRDSQSPPE